MKCNTCQQNSTATISGTYFCSGCASRAKDRLQSFTPTPSTTEAVNILDLNQGLPENQSRQSLHGFHANNLHSHPRPKPAEPSPNQPEKTPKPAIGNGNLLDLSAAKTTAMQPPHTATGNLINTVDTRLSAGGTEPQAGEAPATTMQPHQTYSIKEVPDAAFTDAGYESHPEPDAEATAPAPKKRLRPGQMLAKFNPFNATALRVATVVLSIVVLSGYVTYLNYPNIAVRVAASRANISASLPEYTPGNYRFSGPIAYSPGRLTITFTSGDSNLLLSQSVTKWDSESLRENYVKLQTSRYDTFRENGLTIYAYGNQATWVNGGILYQIESDNHINQADIIKMANSL